MESESTGPDSADTADSSEATCGSTSETSQARAGNAHAELRGMGNNGVRGGGGGRGSRGVRGGRVRGRGRGGQPPINSRTKPEPGTGEKRLSADDITKSPKKRRTEPFKDPFVTQRAAGVDGDSDNPSALKLVPHPPSTVPSATNPRINALQPSSASPNTPQTTPALIGNMSGAAQKENIHDVLDPRLHSASSTNSLTAHASQSKLSVQSAPFISKSSRRISPTGTTPSDSESARASSSTPSTVAPIRKAPITVSIPKALTQNIDTIHAKIARLDRELEAVKETCLQLKKTNIDLKAENKKLKDLDSDRRNELLAMNTTLEEQANAISDLSILIKQTAAGEVGQVGAVEKVTKKLKDNAWNSAVRKAFLGAMGLTNSDNLPRTLDNGFFDQDAETGEAVLRPDFSKSFSENSEWHGWLHTWLLKRGSRWDSLLTTEYLKIKGEEAIFDRVKAIFKHFGNKYKAMAKSGGDVTASRRECRHKQRKATKKVERESCREEAGLAEDCFDFLFNSGYQSTDESDGEDGIDPLTDTESEVPVSVTRKPWISRPHTHRSTQVMELIVQVDSVLFAKRNQKSREKKSTEKKNAACPHPRKRGTPRHRPLPRPKNREAKVPRDAIDPMWLVLNPDENQPSLISDDTYITERIEIENVDGLYEIVPEDGEVIYEYEYNQVEEGDGDEGGWVEDGEELEYGEEV